MWLYDFTSVYVVYLSYILAATVASPTHGGLQFKREVKCQDSKLVVYLKNEATSVKIVTDSGETLLSVNSTNTDMMDLDELLTCTMLLFFPAEGHILYGNNSEYSIIKRPSDNGIELSIVDKMNVTIFNKEIKGSNEGLSEPDVKCAHVHGFKVVVETGVDLNQYDGYNMTALNWATLLGQHDVAKDLVEKGANVNLNGSFGLHPLSNAIIVGDADMVEYLIKHGAPVNGYIGRQKMTPLHFAAYKNRLDCAKVLLKHGASVTSLEVSDGFTPLHIAATEERLEIAKELVGKGADVNARSLRGFTPLHLAVSSTVDLVHFLIQSGADLNSKTNDGKTPLILAVRDNTPEDVCLKMVKHLVEHHSPDLNAKDNYGNTAMSWAVSKGFSKVQAYLKEHGAQ